MISTVSLEKLLFFHPEEWRSFKIACLTIKSTCGNCPETWLLTTSSFIFLLRLLRLLYSDETKRYLSENFILSFPYHLI